ncbi:hypothetical protein LZG04_08625 [Saccharothrix sp. S26]|uniref:hypothetical protein n=1 Tax=Saccharothrix sp. S26 TaxID=2907215 RepID=UPI001F443201|nr:hypothetical protein [Saccharothrix sp. S26]MCE6994867.1 hypothetical protein [Saccharothrix sp. S26]
MTPVSNNRSTRARSRPGDRRLLDQRVELPADPVGVAPLFPVSPIARCAAITAP